MTPSPSTMMTHHAPNGRSIRFVVGPALPLAQFDDKADPECFVAFIVHDGPIEAMGCVRAWYPLAEFEAHIASAVGYGVQATARDVLPPGGGAGTTTRERWEFRRRDAPADAPEWHPDLAEHYELIAASILGPKLAEWSARNEAGARLGALMDWNSVEHGAACPPEEALAADPGCNPVALRWVYLRVARATLAAMVDRAYEIASAFETEPNPDSD